MSEKSIKAWVSMYSEAVSAPQFLASHFRSPPENFYMGAEVEIDVERDGVQVAIALTDITAPANQNERSQYVNKSYAPPVYKESTTLSSNDLDKRDPGEDPFSGQQLMTEARLRAKTLNRITKATVGLSSKLRRGIELQASQIFQTGALLLPDAAGRPRFEMSFGAKSSHFPVVANDWNGVGSTKLSDLEGLAKVIRRDGKIRPNKLVFGDFAWQDFLADAEVQARLDNRRIDVGMVKPVRDSEDAVFQGKITLSNYEFEMWTYDGFYEDPQTKLMLPFVNDDSVIMLSDKARYDLTFGGIPRFPGIDSSRALQYVPQRLKLTDRGADIIVHVYPSEDETYLTVWVGCRPLAIPTAIDTFGCLNTRA